MSHSAELIYVHDPMCSWCWGFRPTLTRLCSQLPDGVGFRRLIGGLAPDSDHPMPRAMQAQLQNTWRRIQERIPGTPFNFDFWSQCQPRRSTYPACRAIIAARILDSNKEDAMIQAIQEAYYLRAMNPSDADTLVQLAGELGLDAEKFNFLLTRDFIDEQLHAEIGESRAIGATSFPSLILSIDHASYWPVAVDYTNPQTMLDTIETLIA